MPLSVCGMDNMYPGWLMFDVKVDCMVNIRSIITYIGATQPWPSDEDYYRFQSVSGKSNLPQR